MGTSEIFASLIFLCVVYNVPWLMKHRLVIYKFGYGNRTVVVNFTGKGIT
jgi:hypothetical protein